MPIYEYLCQSCGHQLEALQKLSDAPLKECPSCGASALKKQLTAAAFRLKGTGWYETDFKHGKSGPPQQSEGAEKDGAAGADGGAKDTGDKGTAPGKNGKASGKNGTSSDKNGKASGKNGTASGKNGGGASDKNGGGASGKNGGGASDKGGRGAESRSAG